MIQNSKKKKKKRKRKALKYASNILSIPPVPGIGNPQSPWYEWKRTTSWNCCLRNPPARAGGAGNCWFWCHTTGTGLEYIIIWNLSELGGVVFLYYVHCDVPTFLSFFFFLDQCSLSPSGFHLTWEPTTRRGRKQTDFALIQSPCRTFQWRNQSGSCPTQDPCHRYLTANPDNKK